ncbi:hypothetical protein R3P38DRAFT_1634593 [Favolaschia claudopus]|uniref:F-box domain-containing protein n=1 Tax=Favolaschia claudopus TaxID=2862362 RepID=A0AAW0DLU7_9AGAR
MSRASQVAALQIHIDGLLSAIEVQKNVLQGLMSQHKEAQRKMNFFLDPMAQLPLEIQSMIFVFARQLGSEIPEPNPRSPPMVFLSVCRMWRDIALSTPALWSEIQLDSLPRGSNYLELGNIWLKRARALPLSVKLNGSMRLDRSVENLIARFSHQIEDLTLELAPKRMDKCQHDFWTRYIQFEPREGASLSSLKTLSIKAEDEEEFYFEYRGEWLDMLRGAPELSGFSMQNMIYSDQWAEPKPEPQPLTLASLHTLHLGKPYEHALALAGTHQNSSVILEYLTLPALRVLSLSYLDIADETLVSFLERSSPPLESLHLIPRSRWGVAGLCNCLRFMSTLIDLQLSAPASWQLSPVFTALATSPDVLPNLRTMTIWMSTLMFLDYEKFSRMLDMWRPASLISFKLHFAPYCGAAHDYTADLPTEQIKSQLRDLAASGVKVHFGPVNDNLLARW